MKRSSCAFLPCSVCVLVISRRTVWPLNAAASLPLAMMRICFASSWSSPNGGADQPTSICPDITCVSVGAGPPVAVGFALRSYCLTNALTMPCVDEPLVEYAMVLPSASFSVLIGEIGLRVPEQVRGAGGFRAQDAHRSALRVGRQHAHDAGRHADVDAARQHRLLRLAAALRVQDLEYQAVLLEDAAALADLCDGRIPVAPLPDGQLERVLRLCAHHGQAEHDTDHRPQQGHQPLHCHSSS